jgi:hypothetical protein
VISPLLANVYLHEVLDTWFARTVQPRLKGRATLIRYADDAVLLFGREDDARRVMAVLPLRFAKYGLTLHPEKTRLIEFRPPGGPRGGSSKPATFDLLGFTHFWRLSRKGYWVVARKTARDRFTRALRAIRQWCRTYLHWPLRQQWQMLVQKLRGHYAYYGIIGNTPALSCFRDEVGRIWRQWLSRRSRAGRVPWTRWALLERMYPLRSGMCCVRA